MQKFLLTRGYKKPTPLMGLRRYLIGKTPATEMVTIIFVPGKIKDVEDEIDVSSLVKDGYIVPVVDPKPTEAAEVEELDPIEDEDLGPEPEPEMEPETDPEPEPDAPEPDPEPAPESDPEPVPDPEEEESKADYEERDGRFYCLHCDKSLKTEDGMISHVESKHQA